MLISSFYGDAFAGQFALRLKGSARNFDIETDLYKWENGASEADRSRLRSKLLARNLLEHPTEDVLFVEPDACFQQRERRVPGWRHRREVHRRRGSTL